MSLYTYFLFRQKYQSQQVNDREFDFMFKKSGKDFKLQIGIHIMNLFLKKNVARTSF